MITETGLVGITYYAQKKLKDINKLSHPINGTIVDKGESLGLIESSSCKLDLLSPVTGSILEVNAFLERQTMKLKRI